MNSRYYMAIFIAVVAVVGGLILYNANTISEIDDEVVTIKKSSVTEKSNGAAAQKEIDVLVDEDFEMDEDDLVSPENLNDMDSVDELVVDEDVVI